MKHGLKHPEAHQLSPNDQRVDVTVHLINPLSGTSRRTARQMEPGVIPRSGAVEPVPVQRPTPSQYQAVSFVSLSDRIADQVEDRTSSRKTAAAVMPGGAKLKFGSLTKTVRAIRQNPPGLALSTLLVLLAGVFVHFFVTG